ncbi:hypothetical protein MKW98_014538, partial [Papaver atlanticum]
VFNYEHLSCPHALAVVITKKIDVIPLCGDYYSRSRWRSMYAPAINPVLTQERCVVPGNGLIVLPPYRDAPENGRRKRKRYISIGEKADKSRKKKRPCSNYHEPGHYASICTA